MITQSFTPFPKTKNAKFIGKRNGYQGLFIKLVATGFSLLVCYRDVKINDIGHFNNN